MISVYLITTQTNSSAFICVTAVWYGYQDECFCSLHCYCEPSLLINGYYGQRDFLLRALLHGATNLSLVNPGYISLEISVNIRVTCSFLAKKSLSNNAKSSIAIRTTIAAVGKCQSVNDKEKHGSRYFLHLRRIICKNSHVTASYSRCGERVC